MRRHERQNVILEEVLDGCVADGLLDSVGVGPDGRKQYQFGPGQAPEPVSARIAERLPDIQAAGR